MPGRYGGDFGEDDRSEAKATQQKPKDRHRADNLARRAASLHVADGEADDRPRNYARRATNTMEAVSVLPQVHQTKGGAP